MCNLTQQIESMDMQDAGIGTPTITREQAEKWGMLSSDHYKFSCLAREVAGWSLQRRREYIDGMKERHSRDEIDRFKAALAFEWQKLRDS